MLTEHLLSSLHSPHSNCVSLWECGLDKTIRCLQNIVTSSGKGQQPLLLPGAVSGTNCSVSHLVLSSWDHSKENDFWSAASAVQLHGHTCSNMKTCCISFYCNRKKKKTTNKSKHHFFPKDIINIFKMAQGNPSNRRQKSKCGQKGSAPFQEFSFPTPLSISWLKFITYIHLHTLL